MAMPNIGLEPDLMAPACKNAYDYIMNIPSEFDYPEVCVLIKFFSS